MFRSCVKKELDLQIEVVPRRRARSRRSKSEEAYMSARDRDPTRCADRRRDRESAEFSASAQRPDADAPAWRATTRVRPAHTEELEISEEPFATIDASGVGQTSDRGWRRAADRPDIKLGIAANTAATGVNSLSRVGGLRELLAYRVPVARLAAAQASLQVKAGK